MDALQSQVGVLSARTNIKKAEVYVLARDERVLNEKDTRHLIEDDFAYELRSFRVAHGKWDDFK